MHQSYFRTIRIAVLVLMLMGSVFLASRYTANASMSHGTESNVPMPTVTSRVTYGYSDIERILGQWMKHVSGLGEDVNGDGAVNTSDLGIIMSHWGMKPSETDGLDASAVRKWSDPKTWDGKLPKEGDIVEISDGTTVLVDQDMPKLGGLIVRGTLTFAPRDVNVETGFILVYGVFQMGSESHPFTNQAVITLSNEHFDADVSTFGKKAFAVTDEGKLRLYGDPKLPNWTRLSNSVSAGSKTLTLETAPDWNAGAHIMVASTSYAPAESEEVIIESVHGNTISLVTGLKYAHFADTTDGIDEYAEVGLLSHNIVVRGDDASMTDGIGGHIITTLMGQSHIENVEVTHMGQRGTMGRYPVHFHFNERTDGNVVLNSSIHHNFNRCLTIHHSNDVLVQGVVAYDTVGHCMFLEDGIETDNQLKDNLVSLVRRWNIAGKEPLLQSDKNPAAFWITNPKNTFEGNVASGSEGMGFWYALAEQPTGLTRQIEGSVAVYPRRTPLQSFNHNVAHSNRSNGLHVDSGPKLDDPTGATETSSYRPIENPTDTKSKLKIAEFKNFTAYKNVGEGAWVRGTGLHITNGKFGDNAFGVTFANGTDNLLDQSLLVGQTGNNATLTPSPIRGFEFYDGPNAVSNSEFVNFVPISGREKAGAIGIRLNDAFPVHALNRAEHITFTNSRSVYLEDVDFSPAKKLDGTNSATFIDTDGSITGTSQSRIFAKNNPILSTDTCREESSWNAMVCRNEQYGILRFDNLDPNARAISPLTLTRDDAAAATLTGTPATNPISTAFTTTLLLNREYAASWGGGYPDRYLRLTLNNAVAGQHALFRIVTSFDAAPHVYRNGSFSKPLPELSDVTTLRAANGNGFVFDPSTKTVTVFSVMSASGSDTIAVCSMAKCQ